MQRIYIESKNNYLKLKKLLITLRVTSSTKPLDRKSLVAGGPDKFITKPTITISSRSIDNNSFINDKFTRKSGNVSPSISIKNIPTFAKRLALVVYDPDAVKVVGKVFLHWFVILDPKASEIPEGSDMSGHKQMLNDSGKRDYSGPSPPPGQTHTYHFKVFAITTDLTFDSDTYYSYEKINNMLKDFQNAEFVAKYRTKSIL